jgi:hypothetical protein
LKSVDHLGCIAHFADVVFFGRSGLQGNTQTTHVGSQDFQVSVRNQNGFDFRIFVQGVNYFALPELIQLVFRKVVDEFEQHGLAGEKLIQFLSAGIKRVRQLRQHVFDFVRHPLHNRLAETGHFLQHRVHLVQDFRNVYENLLLKLFQLLESLVYDLLLYFLDSVIGHFLRVFNGIFDEFFHLGFEIIHDFIDILSGVVHYPVGSGFDLVD